MRGPALLLLAALPALVTSCADSDEATALDLVVEPRATIDQIDIRSVTLDGQAITLAMHLLPHQPTRLHQGDVLRLLFDDDKGGSNVVVTAVGLYQGTAVTANAIAMGTLQTKHPVRANLVLGTGGTGGNGGAGGSGGAGGAGVAGGGGSTAGAGGSTAGGGAAGTGGASGGGGAGRGGTSGSAGAGGTGGASGSGGVAGTTGRGGTGGGGTGGGGRGGSTAGASGTTGAAGRGGTGGTGTAGRGGTGGTGGAGTAGRGGTGGTGGAPACMTVPGAAQAVASEIPQSALGNVTECGFTVMAGGVVTYAALNGSHFALIRDLEFAQSAACGRCIQVDANPRTTVATVVGSCNVIPGACAANGGVVLSSFAYGDVASGTPQFPVNWRYVACQVQGPVYARLEPLFSGVVILNHAYGIAKVEVQEPTGGWLTLARSTNNFWGAVGITLAGRAIRVTDVNGGVVTGNLQGSTADQPLLAQLPMCIAQ